MTKRVVLFISFVIISIKIIVLGLTSFPFDFASYIYQIRQYFDYDIHPLFFWNKGIGLLGIFYIQYGLYISTLDIFNLSKDSIYLLHVFFKLPFLIFDLFSALLLAKIILLEKYESKVALSCFLLWLINPLVFWMTEIQGQYAIMATFLTLLSIYLLQRNKYLISSFVLSIATSIYYYPIFFFPFFIIYTLSQNKKYTKILISTLSIFTLGIIISFLPFFLSDFISQFLSSLVHHASPDAPSFISEINISDLSLFKYPFFLLKGYFPTNLTSPFFFGMISKLTYIGIISVITFIIYRFFSLINVDCLIKRQWKNIVLKETYTTKWLIRDLNIVTLIFLLCIGKLQSHYLIWILPLFLIQAILYHSENFIFIYHLVSILPIIAILGSLNLGIYFLDIITWGKISLWLSFNPRTLALAGFVLMTLLVFSLLILFKQRNTITEDQGVAQKKDFIKKKFLYKLIAIFYIVITYFALIALFHLPDENNKNTLASDRNVFNFPFIERDKNFTLNSLSFKNIFINNADFENASTTSVDTTGLLSKKNDDPWYYYNYGKQKDVIVSITSEKVFRNNQSLKFEVTQDNGDSQINLGSNINNFIKVSPNELYSISGMVWAGKMDGYEFKFSIRFIRDDGSVIPGSDVVVSSITSDTDWIKVKKDFIPVKESSYLETILTIHPLRETQGRPTIYFDDIKLFSKEQSFYYKSDLVSKIDYKLIRDNIINKKTSKYFKFVVGFENLNRITKLNSVKLNQCDAKNILRLDENRLLADYDSTCLNDKENKIFAIIINNEYQPKLDLSLVHVNVPELYKARDKTIVYTLMMVSVYMLICLLFVFFKKVNQIFYD